MLDKIDFYEQEMAKLRYIMDPEEAREILKELGDKVVALDFETTGLDPRYSRVRLSCIYHPDHGVILLDHDYCGEFKHMCMNMLAPMWAVYNAKFEVRWFDLYVRGRVDLIDVDFLAKAKRGGGHSSLALMAKRDLRIELDKSEQLSDWSEPHLTSRQLHYAAMDAIVTYKLYELHLKRATAAQREAAFIFQDAVRATVESEETGMTLDVDYHDNNITIWKRKQEIALRSLRKVTNSVLIPNLNSNKQVSDVLKQQLKGSSTLAIWPKTEKTGQLKLDRNTVAPIASKAPYPLSRWLNAFRLYKYYGKYLSTYGETLITKQHLEGAISYRLNIAAAITGRYSSSSINIQNIPRAPWVRRAFLPPQSFGRFVVSDYSGVEVRVLAELSGDEALLRDCVFGDVHSGSASAIYGIPEDDFIAVIQGEGVGIGSNLYPYYKELRSKAKAFTFQLLYGAGAGALALALKCTLAEAEAAIRAWAKRYPKAYNYRMIMFDKMMKDGYLPVVDGRTIFVPKRDRAMPVAANYPIQGAAASVMYRAMHHTYELREQRSSHHLIRLVASVHDELILACNEPSVGMAKEILNDGMKQGWLDIFPNTTTANLADAAVGYNWGEAK